MEYEKQIGVYLHTDTFVDSRMKEFNESFVGDNIDFVRCESILERLVKSLYLSWIHLNNSKKKIVTNPQTKIDITKKPHKTFSFVVPCFLSIPI